MSRVLHIRFNDKEIAACIDIIQKKVGHLPVGLSAGQAVKLVLKNIVAQYMKQGIISPRTRESAELLIQAVMQNRYQWELPPDLSWEVEITPEDDPQELRDDTHTSVDEISEISRAVEQRILGMSSPDIGSDVEMSENVDPEETRAPIDLTQVERKTLEQLLTRAPADPILLRYKKAKKSDQPPGEQELAAVEIIYTQLSKELWGTEQAANNIKLLLKQAGIGG